MSDLVVEYFPLLDLSDDLLELLAVEYCGAAGYFFRLVCKRLLHIRQDLFGRTKAVLLEGNVDLFKELPNRDCVRLKDVVKGDSRAIVRLLDVHDVQVKISHIRSVRMCERLNSGCARLVDDGKICDKRIARWLKNRKGLSPATLKGDVLVRYNMSYKDVDVLSTMDASEFVGMSALLALHGGVNQIERVEYLLARGALLSFVYHKKPVVSYETLDWLKKNTSVNMWLLSYNIKSEEMLRWRRDNRLSVNDIDVKSVVRTELCLSMIGREAYEEWVGSRQIECDDKVARVLINYAKKEHTLHPIFGRTKHLRWMINECYKSDTGDWMLGDECYFILDAVVETIMGKCLVVLIQECINKFGSELFFSRISMRMAINAGPSMLRKLERRGYKITRQHLELARMSSRCRDNGSCKWLEKYLRK